MKVSNHFLLHAIECMASVVPVSYRRIFNGYGVYHQGVQFAIIINDSAYFRADEYSRRLYLAKKMSAFLPSTLESTESHFFQLPDEVLTQPDELRYWMRIAVEASQNGFAQEDDESTTNVRVKHLKAR